MIVTKLIKISLCKILVNVDYIPSVILKLKDYRKHKNLNKNSTIRMMN